MRLHRRKRQQISMTSVPGGCLNHQSPPRGGIFSHGGHVNSMVAGGHVNSMVAMEVRIEVCADVECTHAVILYSPLAMTDGPC